MLYFSNIRCSDRRGSKFPAAVIRIFFSFMFVLLSNVMPAAGTDTLKNKYPLNDPRNPDCPCHQHQKIADEEYRQLNKSKANTSGSENANSVNKRTGNHSGINGGTSSKKIRIKNKLKRFPSRKKQFGSNARYRIKAGTDPAACFKWR